MLALLEFDQFLFHALNGLNYPQFLDHFFNLVSDLHRYSLVKYGFLPAICLLLFLKYRFKALKVLLGLTLVVASTDLLSYRLIKPMVQRSRPMQTEGVTVKLRTEKSPADYSFPSNHAMNTMAGAVYLSLLFPTWAWLLLGYASLTGFSRVYLGVHGPLDVLGGWFMGSLVAWLWLFGGHRASQWSSSHKRSR